MRARSDSPSGRGPSRRAVNSFARVGSTPSPTPLATMVRTTSANLAGFMGMKDGADFFHVGSVRADRFVELVAGDTKLLGPIGDVGCHLGIDLFQVVRPFRMFFVYG